MNQRTPFFLLALLLLFPSLLSGCASQSARVPSPIKRGALPPYADVAAAYNQRVAPLDSLRASAVVEIMYTDEDGKRKSAQGDGIIQLRRPAEFALSIRKVGQRLFWIGSNDERYWWFDLTDAPVAYVGLHRPETAARRSEPAPTVAAVRPLDLLQFLAINPLPPPNPAYPPAALQWSEDGRLLSVTFRTALGAIQRIWLDPDSYFPQRIQLYDADRNLVAEAQLTGEEPVNIIGFASRRPRIPENIRVIHPDSDTEILLRLSDVSDGRRISSDAFDFDALVRSMHPERVVDLDKQTN